MEDKELHDFKSKLEEALNQFYIDAATYTLERWERELGIPVNHSKPIEFRRSVIKSKLRGSGTVTVKMIKNVAESYGNGEVEIIEDNANYAFTIKFVGIRGIPPNLNDLKTAIEEIKPAHIRHKFSYTYLIWDEQDTKNPTWDELDALNLKWDEYEIGGWL
jgi:uncharacterized protein YmfQ (DUF2313 family)